MDIKLLVNKFCDYSKYIKGFSASTLRRYRFVSNYYVKYSGVSEIEGITADNVRNFFYYGRSARLWKAQTFITFHKSLVVFFRWCIKEGYMQTNFAEDVEVPKLEKHLPRSLKKDDAMRILETAYNYQYKTKLQCYGTNAIFATFIYTGLRKQEVLKLRYTDVDLDNMTMFVYQGKGSKDRIVPICYTLAESLKRYLTERNRLKKTCPEFFVSSNRNMGYSKSGLKRLVDAVQVASRIKFHVHMLRHTFATLMLEGGCDIYSLSKMMGHAAITTTTIYLAASAEHLRSQMTKHPLNNL